MLEGKPCDISFIRYCHLRKIRLVLDEIPNVISLIYPLLYLSLYLIFYIGLNMH